MIALLAATLLTHAPKVPDNVMLQLERTACFGACPVYQVTVLKDGKVHYEGKAHVKVKGKASAQLTPEEIDVLGQMLQDAHFYQERDYTKRTVSDMPSVRIYVHWKDLVHEVHHYLGDRTAPPALEELEKNLDLQLKTEQWVGKEGER